MQNNSVLNDLFKNFGNIFTPPVFHLNTEESKALCGSMGINLLPIEDEKQISCPHCLDILNQAKIKVDIMIDLERERGYLTHALNTNLSDNPEFRRAWENRIKDIDQCLLLATHPRNPAESKAMSIYRTYIETGEEVIQ